VHRREVSDTGGHFVNDIANLLPTVAGDLIRERGELDRELVERMPNDSTDWSPRSATADALRPYATRTAFADSSRSDAARTEATPSAVAPAATATCASRELRNSVTSAPHPAFSRCVPVSASRIAAWMRPTASPTPRSTASKIVVTLLATMTS
jgi:hypothetical protein